MAKQEDGKDGPAAARGDTPQSGRSGRERRRSRPQRVFDTSVPSPCIAICQVDPRTDRCIGCLRHVDEIRNWPIMTAAEKRAVLAALEQRKTPD